MIDFPKNIETYEMYSSKTNIKQLVIAGCIEELTGNEPIDQNLEENLKQCVYRSFNTYKPITSRITEMFPDLVITESKL